MPAAKPKLFKYNHRYCAVFCPIWFIIIWFIKFSHLVHLSLLQFIFFKPGSIHCMYIYVCVCVTRLKRFLEHMTVQYCLKSLQDLADSCVLNFRNKDNNKKSRTQQQRLPFPYVLYILLVLYQKWKQNKTTKKKHHRNIRGVMSSLTFWHARYFWVAGLLEICYTWLKVPQLILKRNGCSKGYLWGCEDDVAKVPGILGDFCCATPQNDFQWMQYHCFKSRMTASLSTSSS